MPSCINNAQNIIRVYPKMSEDFQDESKAKLTNSTVDFVEFFDDNTTNSVGQESDEEIYVPDADRTSLFPENGEVSSSDASCQTAESEVKSLKEWLLLHNDLIQQQNDDILEKERQIFFLQRENEMLKDRLRCFENGLPYQAEDTFNGTVPEELSEDTVSEDMTQDCQPCGEEHKEDVDIVSVQQCDDSVSCSLEVINFEDNLSDIESHIDTTREDNYSRETESDLKSKSQLELEFGDCLKAESDLSECNPPVPEYKFSVKHFSDELDPMKNIRMSIRRKRVCSNSSAVSNTNTEPVEVTEEKKSFRRIKKKRRRITKDTQILMSAEPYETQSNDASLGIPYVEPELPDVTPNTPLEVPRWRVKLYGSCYTMEGTENIDDEVYNKRHMRLEIDERRRKRWDVQRIREQRVIEKLKQRQERIDSGLKGEEQEPLESLWPKMEDVKYLEVGEELPVAAFGHPIPIFPSSHFELPWINNPSALRKSQGRRSLSRRKNSRSKR